MSRTTLQPDRLFDRPWRGGHPLRPRISRSRRWLMILALTVLLLIIGGYAYLTDAQRVEALAESYLSRVLNARVEVGSANLSIFEGLRLDNVVVYVDDSDSTESVIFTADAFRIDYKPQSLLAGKLDAEQIIAVGPHVRLTENLDTGLWNYERFIRDQQSDAAATSQPTDRDGQRGPLFLPELILRDARIEYAEIRDGQLIARGSMAIEGKLSPASEAGRYSFELQARGPTEGVGAVARGSVVPATGQFTMRLNDFDFGRDVLSMMPAQVRRWCEDHGLAGRVDIPELSFTPARRDQPASFRVVTMLNNVTLAVDPREYRGRREIAHQDQLLENVRLLRLGGTRVPGFLAEVEDMLIPRPIKLDGVAGTFVFDQDGIDIQGLRGRLETNAFRINGHIAGYSPDAPLRVRLTSAEHENFYIGQSPRYMIALPGAVREIYDHLRPVGSGRLDFELLRREPGERPEVNGTVEVVNGQFTFDRFPYPLRNVTGRIILRTDPQTRQSALELKDLRGYGIENGPNAASVVRVAGTMAPLGPETAVKIIVTGSNIRQEQAVIDALPAEARQALAALDAEGKRGYPDFRIDFRCDVERLFGRRSKWIVNTDLMVHEASGALKAFPYPLRGLTGLILVREGKLQIVDGAMKRGDATLNFAGDFSWGQREPGSDTPPRVKPNLTLSARNIPIDDDLMAALPEDRRQWITRLGAAGRIDIDGKVLPADDADFGFAIDLVLHEGTLLPLEGKPVITNVAAQAHLTPQKSIIRSFTAKRGDAVITGHGVATWGRGEPPQLNLAAQVDDLRLDEPLYRVLPAVAQRAWDQVRPDGTIDAQVTYSGDATFSTQRPGDALASSEPSPLAVLAPEPENSDTPAGFQITLRPRRLAVRPEVFPYRMDKVSGAVVITNGQVELKSITAAHGEAELSISGKGTIGSQQVWDVQLKGNRLAVDDDLKRALPEALGSLATKLQLAGRISAEFPKFTYTAGTGRKALARVVNLDQPATTQPAVPGSIVFEGTLAFDESSMNVGVQLDEVVGTLKTSGQVHDESLVDFSGSFDVSTLKLAGRPAQNLRARLTQLGSEQAMKIDQLRGELAGGEIAGVIGLAYPDTGPSKYKMELALRNADVRALVGPTEKEMSGQLTASLALEGAWNNPASRRGRGEVNVAGREMYNIPLVLGLLEITNLAVPINSPFKTAHAAYIVAGSQVTFEQIELRSDQMRMAGSGSLDFDNQRVRMTFTTDNPNWPRLPVIGDLIEGARNELLQIQVRGTIEKPKVSAKSFNTFQTTIDEVMRAGK